VELAQFDLPLVPEDLSLVKLVEIVPLVLEPAEFT